MPSPLDTTSTEAAPGVHALLRSCNRVELRAVRSLGAHLHVDRGHVICQTGEFADELFIVLEGAVEEHAGVQDDRQPRLRLGAGAGFGEMAPLARTPRRFTVVAIAPTDLLAFHRREFATLLERAPRVGRALLRAASPRLRPEQESLEELGA